jgi:hypothetical protein
LSAWISGELKKASMRDGAAARGRGRRVCGGSGTRAVVFEFAQQIARGRRQDGVAGSDLTSPPLRNNSSTSLALIMVFI